MSDTSICSPCINVPLLQQRVENDGEVQICAACGRADRKAIPISDILEQIDTAFRKVFGLGGYNEYTDEQEGDDLSTMLYELAAWSDEVVELIANALYEDEPNYNPFDGDEPFYDDQNTYIKLRDVHISRFNGPADTWSKLKEHIRHEARFFSQSAVERLHLIFDDLENAHSWVDSSITRTIGLDTEVSMLFRAREVAIEDKKTIIEILKDPASKLGALPARKTRSNRLNPAGIPALYGSLDPMTCLAELRLPIGSSAIVAQFSITRPLRILDLTNLSTSCKEVSPFDPDFEKAHEFSRFLNRLAAEISRPILPSDTDLEYITTQAVAEYLAHHHSPQFDGILYNSAQERDGVNIVLFHHACRIDGSGKLEGQEFSFHSDVCHDDDCPGILVGYNLSYKSVTPPEKGQQADDLDFSDFDVENKENIPSPALSYIEKSAKVYYVEGVKYSAISLTISYP